MATVTDYEGCTDCCAEPVPFDCDCEPPATLYADWTSSCDSLDSASAVPYTQSGSTWIADAMSLPSQVSYADIYCEDGIWKHSYVIEIGSCSYGPAAELLEPTSGTCSPAFSAHYTGNVPSPCCSGGAGTFDIDVYE